MASLSLRGRTVRPAVAVLVLLMASCSSDTASTAGGDTSPPAASEATTAGSVDTATDDPSGSGDGGWDRIPEIVSETEPSVVALSIVTSGGGFGEGSGVVIDDGLIVTNAHVVGPAERIEVVLADGTRLPGQLLAEDRLTDLALVRVDRDDLPVATLADDYPEVGELAVAVGNPLGFGNSVTAGIVSGVQRALPQEATAGSQALVDLIQTDAAISPGNSGGALVRSDGQIIGITVAYVPPAVGAVSLGFAIPAPTVRDVVDDLLEDGTADHPYLGVQLSTVTPRLAAGLDLGVERGAAVVSLEPDGPAALGGLAAGDVITAIDGETVESVGQLLTRLRRYEPGDTAVLEVQRGGEPVEVTVELLNRPEDT